MTEAIAKAAQNAFDTYRRNPTERHGAELVQVMAAIIYTGTAKGLVLASWETVYDHHPPQKLWGRLAVWFFLWLMRRRCRPAQPQYNDYLMARYQLAKLDGCVTEIHNRGLHRSDLCPEVCASAVWMLYSVANRADESELRNLIIETEANCPKCKEDGTTMIYLTRGVNFTAAD